MQKQLPLQRRRRGNYRPTLLPTMNGIVQDSEDVILVENNTTPSACKNPSPLGNIRGSRLAPTVNGDHNTGKQNSRTTIEHNGHKPTDFSNRATQLRSTSFQFTKPTSHLEEETKRKSKGTKNGHFL